MIGILQKIGTRKKQLLFDWRILRLGRNVIYRWCDKPFWLESPRTQIHIINKKTGSGSPTVQYSSYTSYTRTTVHCGDGAEKSGSGSPHFVWTCGVLYHQTNTPYFVWTRGKKPCRIPLPPFFCVWGLLVATLPYIVWIINYVYIPVPRQST